MNNDKQHYTFTIIPIRKLFYNDANNFGIYTCTIEDKQDVFNPKNTVISGTMPSLELGKAYKVMGFEFIHKKYGQQLQIENVEIKKLNSSADERNFLKNIVTLNQYQEIIKIYKSPITAITSGTFNISKVKGIKEKYFEVLKKKIIKNLEYMNFYSEFTKIGFNFNQMKKIIDFYKGGELSLQIINKNPYKLYMDIKGFGFKTVDSIALSMGIEPDSNFRTKAAILYCLEQKEQNGDTYAFIEDIHQQVEKLLNIKINDIKNYLDKEYYYFDVLRLAKRTTWETEKDISVRLKEKINNSQKLFTNNVIHLIPEIERILRIKYDDKQKELFYKINENNILVLTGFAGTGKSSVLNGLLNLFDKKNITYKLMSPTAKAAKRMEECTGKKASTIHRALGLAEGKFLVNEKNPFAEDVIIIDETSMVDIYLFLAVLKGIKNTTKLLCLGDYGQLESISAGNVLFDMIQGGIPCVKLEKIFRQKEDSSLLNVITNIRNGDNPLKNTHKTYLELGRDCKFWLGKKEQTLSRVLLCYKECLKHFSREDIMVLCPMKKGNSGVNKLNQELQKIANSQNTEELKLKDCAYKKEDLVMHIKNDYNANIFSEDCKDTIAKGIFNGDAGKIEKIDLENQKLYVSYDSGIVEYDNSNLNELMLSYALTIHKVQGSQSKVVIVALDMSHYKMLKRSLLYTAASRCVELLIFICDPKAFSIALNNNQVTHKNTFLGELLKIS
ncbi:RecD/TraA family predicted helicase [Clostridium acetobutylicum]|uniref:Exodeoxyribonuclease V, Alpha subunit, RecD n=1 Tax=Clostridium acetobutylicum (strain ATCC 824 / DSM 792 / JCM 1419 / IAM 19013 / LMG 5710 / NBRC 13948 / NRRL B-527 / VKM B-1787 / 2291 / W) TaxID=272562 RepID=Q97JX9_CLOAB|nr:MULTISPECIES: ATP-dependent RecD-like DNA helicase [Clostridium]AAK79116.1 Exodeoxyribonuclease V, Alpha subunit, RecD [Clostridium acetobutylicum ATCC 824]ADZ20192.1 Exodeoxyribonuclease V, Alpha subunit, RecD [Clostridium acetobutylicum EA 2018]AEI34319.1 exodeoxyribonuclease V, Alpha subunit, RecD [Clostridium acetobutylicum DSM 1731]AWV81631.1 exodeoxyribonuclease V subunit alpha [Clostridium acetobutylicum]MBC2393276.1 AAA family ATPase [Clostridium acetobutylicum]